VRFGEASGRTHTLFPNKTCQIGLPPFGVL
jgi:hypothetical protein